MLQHAAQYPVTTILILLALLTMAWFGYRQLFAGADSRHESHKGPAHATERTDGRSRRRNRARKRDSRTSPDSTTAPALLSAAKSWGYQLQDLDIGQATASPFDMLVIDYALDGDDDSALSPAQVARLKRKADGGRRLCLAYLSVGEAESYRSYWRPEWKKHKPGWLLRENPDWQENYAVRFWHDGWQELIFGQRRAYLDKIIAQGFDGVYLDKCDVFEDLERDYRKVAAERKDLAGDMIGFVQRLAAYARSKSPEFLLVMQNAEGLLRHAALRTVLDGVAKEELSFGQDGGQRRNEDDDYQYARHHLGLMRSAGKPVFVVEYLSAKAKIKEAAALCDGLGFVLTISDPSRELDRLGFDAAIV